MNKSTASTTGFRDLTVISLNDRLEFNERLSDEKFIARDRALNVALRSLENRLDGMNEFREALREQTLRYMPRDEFLSAHNLLVHDMDTVRLDLSRYSVRVDESDKTSSVERAQLDKRLDALNDFRTQLKDQAAAFITRNEVETMTAGIAADVKRLEIAASEKAGRDDSAAAFDRLDVRMKVVESKLATWDGRLWALGTVFLMINIFVSWWLSGIHVPH